MAHIHLMHPDPFFGDFLCQYLATKGYETSHSTTNIDCYTAVSKIRPDLIVLNKESPYLDIEGFFIKKRTTKHLANTPLFVIGDFDQKEIVFYKTQNVFAFLSKKINPVALSERLNIFFKRPQVRIEKRTPMLVDVHAKDSALIIQIEANLDADKILILNYRIRLFCQELKTKTPRIMFIIPSMYDDTITVPNLTSLFGFFEFSELKVDPRRIAVLTRNKLFLDTLAKIPALRTINVVNDYYEGFRSITTDVDIETKISIDFLKVGNLYSLDLFDPSDRVRLPAQHALAQELIDTLKKEKVRYLKYYGKNEKSMPDFAVPLPESGIELPPLDGDPESLEGLEERDLQPLIPEDESHLSDASHLHNTTAMDYITRDFRPVSAELFDADIMNEKQYLFFSKLQDQPLLFVSLNAGLYELVQQALSVHFDIRNVKAQENIKPILEASHYGIVFIDLTIPRETVVKILHVIRTSATRRKTTIILMATLLNKVDLLIYKKYGTDHVVLQPFTTEKFFNKVYQAVTLDRGQ